MRWWTHHLLGLLWLLWLRLRLRRAVRTPLFRDERQAQTLRFAPFAVDKDLVGRRDD